MEVALCYTVANSITNKTIKCMKRSSILISLCLFVFGLLPLQTSAYFGTPEAYKYFTHNGGASFHVRFDQVRYQLGDVMNLKYAVTGKETKSSHLTLQIFSIEKDAVTDDFYLRSPYNGRKGGFCDSTATHPPKSKLLAEKDIPVLGEGELFEGAMQIELNKENGLYVSEEFIAGTPYLYARLVDPDHAFFNYAETETSFCHDNMMSFFVDPIAEYPDFVASEVEVNILHPEPGDAIKISYTLKNTGKKDFVSTGKPLYVCLDKRNTDTRRTNTVTGKDVPISIRTVDRYEATCDEITEIKAGQSLKRVLAVTLNDDALDNTFSDEITDNDQFICGRNRLALDVNPGNNGIVEDRDGYKNNEALFKVDLCGPVKNTPQILPIESVQTPPVTSPTESVQTSPSETEIVKETVPQTTSALPVGVTLYKSPIHPAVYWVQGGERHPFPHKRVYDTWFSDFSHVKNVSPDAIEAIPLGNPMGVKTGVGLIKFPYNSKVYEVLDGNVLTHIPNEAAARASYGTAWSTKIVTLREIYSLFYTFK